MLSQCLKTRMRVIYGVELVLAPYTTIDAAFATRGRSNSLGHGNGTGTSTGTGDNNGASSPSPSPPGAPASSPPPHTRSQGSVSFARSDGATAAAQAFQEESGKIG